MSLQALENLSREPQVLKMLEGLETVSAEHLAKGHQCGGAKFGHRLTGCSMMKVPFFPRRNQVATLALKGNHEVELCPLVRVP